MINWRSGLAGFNGATKRLIKGVFGLSYTITSETVVPDKIVVSVLSIINPKVVGVTSLITEGVSVESKIVPVTGILSIISAKGVSITSQISGSGVSVESEL